MLKYINKIFQVFIDILVFIITVLIFFSLYNFISLKVLNKEYSNVLGVSIFEIVSGSMEPTLNVKDLIVVKKTSNISKNDIITYIDGKDFITHRVIKIEGNTLTTKGDSNNSDDVRIDKSKVIGKVILRIPKGGVLREVFTTPKVIVSIVVTLILISLSISYIPKDKRKKVVSLDDKFEDPDCIYKKQVKYMFDRRKLLKSNKLTIAIILLAVVLTLIPIAYSKLFSKTDSDSKIETALYILNTDYYEKEVKLDELVPSDTPYVYNFKVANNDGKNRLETKLEYTLKIVTTTNLPLSYKLYMNENYNYNASTNIITKDTIEKTGEDGAYFRTLETAKQTFGFDKDEENIYHLVVTFPKEYDSFEYQDIIEGVTICIESKQIIDKNAQ